jgi:hypothetical protein
LNPKNEYYSNLDEFSENLNFSKTMIYPRTFTTQDDEMSMLKPLQVQSQSHLHNKNYPHNVVPMNLLVCGTEISFVEQEYGTFDMLNCPNIVPNIPGESFNFTNPPIVDPDQSEVLNLNDISMVGGNFFQESD